MTGAVALLARRAFVDLLIAFSFMLAQPLLAGALRFASRIIARAAVPRAWMALRSSSSTWLSRGWGCAPLSFCGPTATTSFGELLYDYTLPR